MVGCEGTLHVVVYHYKLCTFCPTTIIILVEMQALWGEPTSDFTRMRRNRMHVCCGLVAEWLSLASLLCSESMLRRCAKSTFETFELQRPMYVRCKPHVPLLNLNRTHAPSEGDGRTIHDNIYKYTDSAGVDRTRRGSLRLAPIIIPRYKKLMKEPSIRNRLELV